MLCFDTPRVLPCIGRSRRARCRGAAARRRAELVLFARLGRGDPSILALVLVHMHVQLSSLHARYMHGTLRAQRAQHTHYVNFWCLVVRGGAGRRGSAARRPPHTRERHADPALAVQQRHRHSRDGDARYVHPLRVHAHSLQHMHMQHAHAHALHVHCVCTA